MTSKDKYLMVAAIDFGTTYSGYAFSMRHEFTTDPLQIHANQAWNSGGRSLLSLKTPTCLLLNSMKELIAFGYDAENRYAEIALDGEQNKYFYFYRFKMNLHNNKNITTEMVMRDLSGKTMPAIDVFGLSIKALVRHLMDLLEKRGTTMTMKEIRWVLTVPAIWTDNAKQFMRKSAEKAGIPSDRLLLALEPEAASVYCQHLPTEKLYGAEKEFSMSKSGVKYMVVDLGGGTADITVHETLGNGQLKEIHRATGNDCGGTSVDKMFFQMLEDIFGGYLIRKLIKEDPSAYLDLNREFETVKRNINSSKTDKINFSIPYAALDRLCSETTKRNLPTAIQTSCYSKQLSLRGDKMRADVTLMKKLFIPTVDSIVLLIKDILSNMPAINITKIIMVGGFAECLLIQESVKESFPKKKFIIPEEAGLAVLKGAVLYGHRPDYFQSRIMRLSYGIRTSEIYDRTKHDIKHVHLLNGQKRCFDIFHKIVEKDQKVFPGESFESEFSTVEQNQIDMHLDMYVSTSKRPVYTDEEGCEFVGKIKIDLPDPCKEERWVDAEFIFGNTEIDITATDRKTKKTVTAKYNLV